VRFQFYAISDEAKKLTSLFVRGALCELIEYVEVAFVLDLAHDPSLLQEIICDLSTNRFAVSVEHNLEIFPLE
jgi:hypothetical protein